MWSHKASDPSPGLPPRLVSPIAHPPSRLLASHVPLRCPEAPLSEWSVGRGAPSVACLWGQVAGLLEARLKSGIKENHVVACWGHMARALRNYSDFNCCLVSKASEKLTFIFKFGARKVYLQGRDAIAQPDLTCMSLVVGCCHGWAPSGTAWTRGDRSTSLIPEILSAK